MPKKIRRHARRAQTPCPPSILNATHQVPRDRLVDFLRVRQLQVGHELDELVAILGQSRVEALLFIHSGGVALLVVVARVHDGVARQAEDLRVHRVVKLAGVALLEVRAAATPDQQRIAGEDHARGPREQPRDATVRVPRRRQSFKGEVPKRDFVVGFDLDVCLGARGLRDHCADPGKVLTDAAAGGDVVGVTVCVEHVAQLQSQLVD
mmetsp:Transcript_122823/g.352764  ORF Transcript_122823/g.352764 Transcript_122823/m.352764 type:complete len:208 (+) Transcript_122823:196-819(+)